MNVLIIEPYFGGSHEKFISGITRFPLSFTVLSLPARKWKWRMRLSAPYFAEMLKAEKKEYDRIICSSFLDVAAFRGLAPSWVNEVPLLTYFHENQFAYPVRVEDKRDFHFGLTNLTTALASDSICFNSRYNLRTFFKGVKDVLKHSYDLGINDSVSEMKGRAEVIPPGIDFDAIDAAEKRHQTGVPVVVWNHRWEHDKNPEEFFEALFDLKDEGAEFNLIVLGESFKERPSVFDEAMSRLSDRILHFGYAKSRTAYTRWLRTGDIAVSTSKHEFFGMSVIEAVRAGLRPLLPERLSYPELFPGKYLYKEGSLKEKLGELLKGKRGLTEKESMKLTEPYSWKNLEERYVSWISEAELRN